MKYSAINLQQKFSLISEYWQPRVVAELNDYQFKLVKLEGEFVWHKHDQTDETFIVISGELTVQFRDGFVEIGEGEMFVVPRGVEHKPFSRSTAKVLIIEPRGVVNTGDGSENKLTAKNDQWV
jgi:mannose-6-phosphate isomerase-like protein (cupin superfamily)